MAGAGGFASLRQAQSRPAPPVERPSANLQAVHADPAWDELRRVLSTPATRPKGEEIKQKTCNPHPPLTPDAAGIGSAGRKLIEHRGWAVEQVLRVFGPGV